MSVILTMAPCALRSAGAAACERKSGAWTLVPIIAPSRDRDLAHRRLEKRRRIVDQSVETSECLQRLLDERRQLRHIEQIGLDQCNGACTLMDVAKLPSLVE